MDNLLEKLVLGREAELVRKYIVNGPTYVRNFLNLSEKEWKVVFDHLVFEHNLLYKTVISSGDFFLDTYIEHGMTRVRDILEVLDLKYDSLVEVIFDYIVIAQGGLKCHVASHREKYAATLRSRGGDFVRKVLGLWKEKYVENWESVLDVLMATTCEGLFAERNFEEGMGMFMRMANMTREHRKPFRSGLFIS